MLSEAPATGGKDKPLDADSFCDFQNHSSGGVINLIGILVVGSASGIPHDCGEMNDVHGSIHGAYDIGNIAAISGNEFEAGMIQKRRYGLIAVDQAVKQTDTQAAIEELGNNYGTDITGSTEDKNRPLCIRFHN